jgi:hypothetical protein
MARHALKVLNQLREYDSFLDSLHTIVDMGCGSGEDITWWATLESRDDPPKPYNYNCFAVDRNADKLAQIPKLKNIHTYEKDFNQPHCTPTSLIYMLAVNGFDCKDAYLLKEFNDPWIHIAVYKSAIAPMDASTTSWFDLIDAGLLNTSVVDSINSYGYLRQEDILYPWLDRENYFIDYVSQWTEIPEEATRTFDGVINISTPSDKQTIKQANILKKEPKIAIPIGILRPPKKKYD